MREIAAIPYADERNVKNMDECLFYHVMEVPGFGLTIGQWDLRGRVDAYLGGVRFAGKRVLDVGTASGFLCFEMEKRGADVVGYDLSENQMLDLVPFGGSPPQDSASVWRGKLRQMNNGWWLARTAFKSNAKVVYGSVYEIPETIGAVDISLFGCILLHLRDPFLALQRAAVLTTETLIVTDVMPTVDGIPADKISDLAFYPDPDHEKPGNGETWWRFTPALVARYLKILGFKTFNVSYHDQKHVGDGRAIELPLFTVVSTR